MAPGPADRDPDPDAARLALLRRRYPALGDLERRAARRIPRFALDFLQGGAGDESGLRRNRAALQSVEIVPRYGMAAGPVDTSVQLFGQSYAAPLGIAPVGFDGLLWPGATRALAEAAQRVRIPYLVGALACETIENVAALAPDVTWFQLYPLPAEDHRLSHDLADRARAAGAQVLVATLDVPVRPKRPRDLRQGFVMPFRLTPRLLLQMAAAPPWLAALARRGRPRFANLERYSGGGAEATARFVQSRVGGGFAWEALARLRDRWPRAMMVKGILHPADAERALALGIDGILVSNHGGRQFEAAPASVDVLPEIVRVTAGRATLMLDSGITSGTDGLRALALGAEGVFVGRAFILALAALGDIGARHMAETLIGELAGAMAQVGIARTDQARGLSLRHPGACSPADFGHPG